MVSINRVLTGATREREWAILVSDQSLDDVLNGAPLSGPLLTSPKRDTFWADPFPIRAADGSLWVFVEEMHRWLGLGAIVALQVDQGRVLQRKVVLRGRHHYSFPQVHMDDGTWLATVQSCDPMAPMYTFAGLGEPWLPTLRLLPAGLIDPAVSAPWRPAGHGRIVDSDPADVEFALGLRRSANDDVAMGPDWFMVATTTGNEFAGYTQWKAAGGIDWREQPVQRFENAQLARSGGNLDGARGLRVAQDCAENYGVATSILTWAPWRQGEGKLLRRVNAADIAHAVMGTHTLSWTADGNTVVADVWRYRRQVKSAAHRVLERRHTAVCRGAKINPLAKTD